MEVEFKTPDVEWEWCTMAEDSLHSILWISSSSFNVHKGKGCFVKTTLTMYLRCRLTVAIQTIIIKGE